MDERSDNLIAALLQQNNAFGLAWLDLASGRFRVTELETDASLAAELERLRPAGNQTPVRLFSDYAPGAGMDHVPDPYYTRDFDGVLDLIEEASEGLRATL